MKNANPLCLISPSQPGGRRSTASRLNAGMFEVILDAARTTLDCPIAVLDVRSASISWISCRIRPPLNTPQTRSAIQRHLPRVADTLVIGDMYLSDLPADNPLVNSSPFVRALVSVPLVLEDGSNLGSLCALDVRSREFTPASLDQMKLLASCASNMIGMHLEVEQAGQERRRAEARANDAEHREQILKHAEQMAQVGAWWIDPQGAISWSDEVRRLHDLPDNLPVTPGRILGLYSKRDRTRLRRALCQIGKDHQPFEIVADMHSPKGRKRRMRCVGEVHFGEGETVVGCHGIFQDVTDHQAASQALWRSAHVDFLTAIPNRRWFHNALAETIGKSEFADTRIALLLLDIDRFKDVNDGLGHEAGDAVLRTIAERLAPLREKGIFVARLAGDEFAMFLATTAPDDAIRRMAEHIQVEVARPIQHQQRTIRISCSTGIAIYPDQAQDSDELLACADMALYRVKHHGRNNYCLFTPELGSQFAARRTAIDAIRNAADEGGIVPHYQPKLRLSDGALIGFEALCRLQHGDGSLVQPTEFKSALDDPASAQLVHDRLLDQLASDAATWLASGVDPGILSFNAHAQLFNFRNYAGDLLGKFRKWNVPPSIIEVEINEEVMWDRERSSFADVITPLKTAGFRVSLDDFGTGSATLVHLRDLNLDCIKIDRSFVMKMESCDRSLKIIRSLVGLSLELGIESLAEGVETKGQRLALQMMGCQIGQGFLFGQPMPANEIPSFVSAMRRPDKPVATVIPRRIGATVRSDVIGMRVVK